MGWDYFHKAPGVTTKQVIERDYPSNEIVQFAMVGSVAYVAMRRKDTPDAPTIGVVVLTARAPRDYFNFGYKVIDEFMGPAESHCPAKVLDALSPTDAEYAVTWRARCRANLAKPMPQNGDLLCFASPLVYGSGEEVIEAVYHQEGRSKWLTVPGKHGRYGLPKLTNCAFTIWGQSGPPQAVTAG